MVTEFTEDWYPNGYDATLERTYITTLGSDYYSAYIYNKTPPDRDLLKLWLRNDSNRGVMTYSDSQIAPLQYAMRQMAYATDEIRVLLQNTTYETNDEDVAQSVKKLDAAIGNGCWSI